MSRSPMQTVLARLVELGPAAHAVLDGLLDEMPAHEIAALTFDWQRTWARPSQVIPVGGDWRSWGACSGRGWGKTVTSVSFAIDEISEGRARRLALVAQSEAKCIEIFVTGETGFLAMTPPWLGVAWESSTNRLIFGNGATATVYTAQEPNGLRGPQHDLALATEIAAWPAATRIEAMANLRLGLRLGYGRLLWDSTPRRRNPLIRERLAMSAQDPARHLVVRGSTRENAIHLSPSAVAEWEAEWGGTARGAEELEGQFFDDAEDALFKQSWIEKSRRGWPERLVRRIISVDPAITANPKYSDATGIVEMGTGIDGQVFALRNLTGVHRAETWPGMVIDAYVAGRCDVILVETNRGGSAWAALLRGAASARGLTLIELGPLEVPGSRPDVVYMRAIHSRGQKAVRASGAAALVERGRVSFVVGALGDLEDRLCAFDGSDGAIDDCVDAFVAGCHELGGLGTSTPDPRIGFVGIVEAAQSLRANVRPTDSQNISTLLGLNAGYGGRI